MQRLGYVAVGVYLKTGLHFQQELGIGGFWDWCSCAMLVPLFVSLLLLPLCVCLALDIKTSLCMFLSMSLHT